MKFYIYEIDTKEVAETVEGETNKECEAAMGNYDTDIYGGTYSPAFGAVDGLTRD